MMCLLLSRERYSNTTVHADWFIIALLVCVCTNRLYLSEIFCQIFSFYELKQLPEQ